MPSDLFADQPPLDGLSYRAEVLSPAEQKDVVRRLGGLDLEPFRFQRWEARRLTRTFGWRYDFERSIFVMGEPLPGWLLAVRKRTADAFGLNDEQFGHALVARYDPGAGIGWHRDRPVFEQVLGLSLAAPAVLRFRQRRAEGGFRRLALPIEPRSAYHLAGTARHEWEHRILPGDALRFSITFRTLSEAGRRRINPRAFESPPGIPPTNDRP